jgi:hypothetical protein
MNNISFPEGIKEEQKLEYRVLQLVCSVLSAFREYWGYSIEKTVAIFKENNIYNFISKNYDFYHTVGKVYIIEDICECLNLPKGRWKK